jgi:hypothetical protein
MKGENSLYTVTLHLTIIAQPTSLLPTAHENSLRRCHKTHNFPEEG